MKQSPIRDASRRIQDIVAEDTGRRLGTKAQRQVEAVLTGVGGGSPGATARDNFSTREVTILLADLRGFTSLSAAYPAGVVLELLNVSFVRMSEIIVRHGGTIDKFMGDSIMVIFFGEPRHPLEHVRRALRCAVDMQISMEALNEHHRHRNLPPLYMGIGVNSGRVMAGLVGSKLYSAYTVIGEEVNLTSRIEAFSLRGQVLISEATFERCGGYAATGEPMDVYVKGKKDRVRLREVLGIPSLRKTVPRQEIRRSPRVGVQLPFSYQLLQKKIVLPETLAGTILDVGYHGVLARLARELPLYTELKLDLELPLVAHRATDLYARIVKVGARDGACRAGLEFTALSPETNAKLQLCVQMLIQGEGDYMPSAAGSQRASAGNAKSSPTRMKSAARKGSVPR